VGRSWRRAPQPRRSVIKMFLPSKFYIHKEDDQILEFREKRLKLFAGCMVLILLGLLCFYPIITIDQFGWRSMVLSGIGIVFTFLGIVPMLTIGCIVINSQDKSISFNGGLRKFIFTPVSIPFSKVSYIKIKEDWMYRYGTSGGTTWDKIIVKLNGQKDVVLDHSRNDEYINQMTYKISQLVECKVHYERL
jgi:hypothetical protein